jgi:hypothetical protein
LPGLLSWFRREWEPPAPEAVWGDRPSLYEHIRRHFDPGRPGLLEGGEALPDEAGRDSEIHWVPGGMDGSFGHHFGGGADSDTAGEVFAAVRECLARADPARFRHLYSLIAEENALDFVDPLLEKVRADNSIHAGRVRVLAHWLATQAPDREPVKLGVALLGLFPGDEDRDLFLTLGRHEEFTLYVAVALASAQEKPEEDLWELAKNVSGWGRIQAVERLAETRDPRIRRWLLVEGYRNSIMVEYTACLCARAGNLKARLLAKEPEEDVLRAAGDLIQALAEGGPAEDMEDYEDGATVTVRYLELLRHRAGTLEQLLAVDAIARFLDDEDADWAAREECGWTPRLRQRLRKVCEEVLSRPEWRDHIQRDLAAEDEHRFFVAARAARALGMEVWDRYFERLKGGDACWFHVMQTDDPDRIDCVLAIARERIDLEAIATGPDDLLGLGPGHVPHNQLDFILQDLHRFPGRGWDFIRAGLRSPVVRNRNMALSSLASWGRENWVPETEMALRRALREEPKPDVRERIEKVLAGQELEPPGLDDESEDEI